MTPIRFPSNTDIATLKAFLQDNRDKGGYKNARAAFNRIAKYVETEPHGGESHPKVLADVISKADDLPHHQPQNAEPVVLVYNAADISWGKASGPRDIMAFQYVKPKPGAMALYAATPEGRSYAAMVPQSFVVKMQFALYNIIGCSGVGWFAEIFSRLAPLSWRVWRPEKKVKVA